MSQLASVQERTGTRQLKRACVESAKDAKQANHTVIAPRAARKCSHVALVNQHKFAPCYIYFHACSSNWVQERTGIRQLEGTCVEAGKDAMQKNVN